MTNQCVCTDSTLLKEYYTNKKIKAVLFQTKRNMSIEHYSKEYDANVVEMMKSLHNGKDDKINKAKNVNCKAKGSSNV